MSDVPLPGADTLIDLFRSAAQGREDHPAIVDRLGSRTYGELFAEVDRTAAWLRTHATGAADAPVATLLPQSADALVTMLSVMAAGRLVLPLDSDMPPAALVEVLRHAGAAMVITDGPLPFAEPGLTSVEREHIVRAASEPSAGGVGPAALDPANLFYTSGSSGRPKGVVVTHAAQVAGVRSWCAAFDFRPDDVVGVSFHHSFGAARIAAYGALAVGATLHVHDFRCVGGKQVVQQCNRAGLTIAHMAPALVRLAAGAEAARLRTLRTLIVSAEGLHPADVALFDGVLRPTCTLVNCYALSETGPVTSAVIERGAVPDVVPIGRPLPGKLTLLDATDETGAGELLVGGAGLAAGYWNDPGLTAERFVAGPDGTRRLRTRDRVREVEGGAYEFVGRLDSVLKVRGHSVDAAAVERAILRSGLAREAVVALHPRSGRLVAYVVPASGATASTATVRAALAATVPAAMLPGLVVAVEEMPRTGRDKADRAALEALLPPPDADVEGPATTADAVPAAVLAALHHVLDHRPIGLHDRFSALGGDSLAAAEAVAVLSAALGREVPLSVFVGDPSAADIARLLAVGTEARPLHRLAAGGPAAPVFLVHGAGGGVMRFETLAGHLATRRPVWALQLVGDPARRASARVERLAALYVEQIRAAYPDPQRVLAGFSFGGAVAVEMGRILTALGEPPVAVVLFDTTAPWMWWRGKGATRRVVHDLRVGLRRWSWRLGRGEFDADPFLRRALRWYRPEPYAGAAVFVEAAGAPIETHLGWRHLLPQMRLVRSPGDHDSFIGGPEVVITAKLLNAVLDQLAD